MVPMALLASMSTSARADLRSRRAMISPRVSPLTRLNTAASSSASVSMKRSGGFTREKNSTLGWAMRTMLPTSLESSPLARPAPTWPISLSMSCWPGMRATPRSTCFSFGEPASRSTILSSPSRGPAEPAWPAGPVPFFSPGFFAAFAALPARF